MARRGKLINVWHDDNRTDKSLSSLLASLGTILEDVTQWAVPALGQRKVVNHDDHRCRFSSVKRVAQTTQHRRRPCRIEGDESFVGVGASRLRVGQPSGEPPVLGPTLVGSDRQPEIGWTTQGGQLAHQRTSNSQAFLPRPPDPDRTGVQIDDKRSRTQHSSVEKGLRAWLHKAAMRPRSRRIPDIGSSRSSGVKVTIRTPDLPQG